MTFAGISQIIDDIVAFIKDAADKLTKFIAGLKNGIDFGNNMPDAE